MGFAYLAKGAARLILLGAPLVFGDLRIRSTPMLAEGKTSQASSCSLDSAQGLVGLSTAGLSVKTFEIEAGSTEGSEAVLYGAPSDPKIITLKIFGETGKVELWFALGDGITFVSHKAFHYADRLAPRVAVASIVTSEFVICEGRRPGYPNSTDVRAYDEAVRLLTLVRRRLSLN